MKYINNAKLLELTEVPEGLERLLDRKIVFCRNVLMGSHFECSADSFPRIAITKTRRSSWILILYRLPFNQSSNGSLTCSLIEATGDTQIYVN